MRRSGEQDLLYRNKDLNVAVRGLFVRPVDSSGRTLTGFTLGAVVSLFEAGTSTRGFGGGAPGQARLLSLTLLSEPPRPHSRSSTALSS